MLLGSNPPQSQFDKITVFQNRLRQPSSTNYYAIVSVCYSRQRLVLNDKEEKALQDVGYSAAMLPGKTVLNR